ncbi:MAG: efflux RND transporter permease subunit [Desulfonatronovibrio sp.]|nr:efflux RND transporter permease subunit [Desulfovibrionales bacterium]
MNITKWAMNNKNTVLIFALIIILGGVSAYFKLGKLKNPELTIQTALVITEFPGASPGEVERLVTDPLEKAVQAMGQLKHVRSKSEAGRSTIFVDIKDSYPPSAMPQIWTDLRERIRDARAILPPGAGRPDVIDHFGRSYGILLALTGDGYSMRELREYANYMKKRLKKCEDAQGVTVFGIQEEQIVLEVSREKLLGLGLGLASVQQAVKAQNLITDYGHLNAGDNRIRISPSGNFESVEDIKNIILDGSNGNFMRLGDIADVRQEYIDPPQVLFRMNGKPALAIGVSTVKGGNTVVLGKSVKEEIKNLSAQMPAGLQISIVNFQADVVMDSINTFITALLQAIGIVLVVLLIALGFRSAIVITNGLIFNICATFIIMQFLGIDMQIVSLSALIIALGMLVDDSVVVTDNTMVEMEQNKLSKEDAGIKAAQSTGFPQFIATFIAICSFLPMAMAKSSLGEYCQSLTYVVAIALGVSWVQAMAVVPVMSERLLKVKQKKKKKEPYSSFIYRVYLALLRPALKHRWVTMGIVVGIFLLASYGFQLIPYALMNKSERPQYKVDYWLPEGTRLHKTSADLQEIEKKILSWPEVTGVATTVGSGPPRFMLGFSPELANVAYGSMIVRVKPHVSVSNLIIRTQDYIASVFPESDARASEFIPGGMPNFLIQARISGDDPEILRKLSAQVKQIMRDTGKTEELGLDWRNQVPVWKPDFMQAAGGLREINRESMARTMRWLTKGSTWEAYRADKHLMPIVFRAPKKDTYDFSDVFAVPVSNWESAEKVPLGAVMGEGEVVMEDPIIHHYDRMRTITVRANPKPGVNSSAFRSQIAETIKNEVDFPFGYNIAWGGLYEASKESNDSLNAQFPVALTLMLMAVILLFNGVRSPLIVILSLPLCIVGVVAGMLLSGKDMGFMPLFGIYALIGMIIRNVIILIMEMEDRTRGKEDKEKLEAVVQASLSRVRPVLITACCTSFGMIPLLSSPMFGGMAVTIMGGLLVGTLITLLFIPVLYTLFYRVKPPQKVS